jgi:hypothetical protein
LTAREQRIATFAPCAVETDQARRQTHVLQQGQLLILTLDYINRHRADNSILREIAQNSDFQFPHYRHMNSRHEPLLWLPDIIAWCYGRGGTWRDAVEPLVTEVIEI